MPLTTTLHGDNLRKAKKVLSAAGLFFFEVKMVELEGKQQYEHRVINLHGSRTSYWKTGILSSTSAAADNPHPRTDNPHPRTDNPHPRTDNPHPRTDNPADKSKTNTQQRFQKLSVSLSGTFQNPPHTHPTTPPGEEELKLKKDEVEEGSKKGVVGGTTKNPTPRPSGRKQQKEGIAESQNSVGGELSGAVSQQDELQAKFLKWVIEVYLPTTNDYQEGKIMQLRPYALQTIANDTGGALEREFLKALKAESEEAKYREIEATVQAYAAKWEAAGRGITICRDYEDGIMGMPSVIIDQSTHISGPDFLRLPIDSCTPTPPPIQGELLVEVQKQRRSRQTKIKSIERWGRLSLGQLVVEEQWIADLLDAWSDTVLQASITQLVTQYPGLGLLIDGERLIEEEF